MDFEVNVKKLVEILHDKGVIESEHVAQILNVPNNEAEYSKGVKNQYWHNTVCLDFDGVIGVFPHPKPEIPIDGAMEGIHNLLSYGWFLEIYSGGSKDPERLQQMKDLLEVWSRKWDSDRRTYPEEKSLSFSDRFPDRINFSTGKPTAKIYVDDRGLTFTGWDTLTPEVLENFRAWWQAPNSTH